MKVISAGHAKTGTTSMCAALATLGYKTYDYVEHYWYHGKDWNKILTTGGTVEDFKRMYEDVDAVTDVPACYFWEEILKAFPDSKIILTIRDQDSWFKSYSSQQQANGDMTPLNRLRFLAAYTAFNPLYLWRFHHYIKNMMRIVHGAEPPFSCVNEIVVRKMYRHHNLDVLQNAPKDKLLIYKVSDGWEPLCKFLGNDIPDQPFPHKNANAQFINEMIRENPIVIDNYGKAKVHAFIITIILAAMLAFVLYS